MGSCQYQVEEESEVKEEDFKSLDNNANALSFHELDFISPTNDDCLLKVLGHCDWKTVGVVPQLSRRFKSLSNHPSYPTLRKPYYALSIVQDRFYDGFFLDPHKETEERTLAYKVLRGFNKANDTKEVRHLMDIGERFVDKTPTKWPNPEVHIPDRLFDNIQSISKRYSYERLHIHGIHLTESFISRCLETFANNILESMEINRCILATTNGLIHELFLESKIRSLDLECESVDSLLFNEEFVRKFSEKSDNCKLCATLSTWIKEPVYWRPSREFFPVICKFDTLYLDLIILDTNHLVELIMLRFSLPFDSINFHCVRWNISLTRKPTRDDLANIDRQTFHVRGWTITKMDIAIQCDIDCRGSTIARDLHPTTEIRKSINIWFRRSADALR